MSAEDAGEDKEQTDQKGEDGTLFSKKGKGPAFKRRTKPKAEEGGETGSGPTQTAAHLRVTRDLAELELPPNVTILRKDDECMEFSLVIYPNMGYWKGGMFEFKFNIAPKYPYDGPKVVCVDKLYHPNIDLEGKICVNVLRPWKPTYSVQIVLFGLLFLFTHPNPNDPLNNEAAADMRANADQFGRNVKLSLNGKSVGGVSFPKNRGPGPFT